MLPTPVSCIAIWLVLACVPMVARGQQLPDWTGKIRTDHPRLFFNAPTWPAVKQRALGAEHDWYRRVQLRVDSWLAKTRTGNQVEPQDLGPEAAAAAFVYLMTEEPRYLELAKNCLRASVAFYEQCYDQRKTVNWYSTSRVHAVMAWDWLYTSLTEAERREFMSRLILTGPDDTYCLFTCGGSLRQHRHYDALNFVIYHRGFLALDSGTRYEEFTNGQHLANYFAQTVAHNCVVLHQPGEPVASYWGGTVEGNHGGQHRQLGSVVRAYETNDDFAYVAGDATACYQHGAVRRGDKAEVPEKCSLATRQLVFLLPRHFVIFDRVTTTDAGSQKDWLIHTAREPAIDGQAFRADHRDGRMWCRTLLPKDARLTPVGGPGNEFLAAGKNWTIDTRGLRPENLALMGQWRVEVTPAEPRKEDVFLHVIQVGDQQRAAMDPTTLIEEDGRCGVRLAVGQDTWEVMFNTTGDLGGHLRRTGSAPAIDRPLTSAVQPQSGLMLRSKSP